MVRKVGEYTIIDVSGMEDGDDILLAEDPETGEWEIIPHEDRCQICDNDKYKHEIVIDEIIVKVCDECKKREKNE